MQRTAAKLTAAIIALCAVGINALVLPQRPHRMTRKQQQQRTSEAMSMSASTKATTGKQQVIVVGGGPAGALLSIFLARDGRFEVDLFEGRHEKDISGPTIRSYNIVFMKRGLSALEAAGINLADCAQEAGKDAIMISGNVRHHVSPIANQKMFRETISMCRGDAAITLLEKAKSLENVTVHFGCSLVNVNLDKRIATFEGGDGETIERCYDMLVGADGVNSKVRSELVAKVPDFSVTQRKDPMVYKIASIPVMNWSGATEQWKTSFHVYKSRIGCLLAPPRGEEDLAAVVIQPEKGRLSFSSLMKTSEDVKRFFAKWYPGTFGAEGPSPEIVQDFLDLRPQQLTTTYCSRLNHGDVVLIGDAAHSMLASLGQGVQTALEDCRVLAEVLAETRTQEPGGAGLNIPRVLETYNERRHDDAIAACKISEMGMGNNRSMRLSFISQLALVSLLSKTLGRLFPKIFTPPSIMKIGAVDWSYGQILRGMRREKTIVKVIAVAIVAVAARSWGWHRLLQLA